MLRLIGKVSVSNIDTINTKFLSQSQIRSHGLAHTHIFPKFIHDFKQKKSNKFDTNNEKSQSQCLIHANKSLSLNFKTWSLKFQSQSQPEEEEKSRKPLSYSICILFV